MSQVTSAQIQVIHDETQEKVQQIAPSNALERLAQVHKFGGSSLATISCVARVADIIEAQAASGDIVVVSANGDTTDLLIALVEEASVEVKIAKLDAIEKLQSALIAGLLPSNKTLAEQLAFDIKRIQQWIYAAEESQTSIEPLYNDILAFGEVWSARLLSAVLTSRGYDSTSIDAREFLHVTVQGHDAVVDYQASQDAIAQKLDNQKITVVTGFIAIDKAGATKLLGRNGSDYSATIVANLISAESVTIWTDVTGVYSADPRLVKDAYKFDQLSQPVACELARLGNPVLHEKTIGPILNTQTQLTIASSFESQVKGTAIVEQSEAQALAVSQKQTAHSVTYLNGLVHIYTPAYNQVSAAALNRELSPILNDEFEHTLVIKSEDLSLAKRLFEEQPFNAVYSEVSLLAVVGDNVANNDAVKAHLLDAVPENQIFAEYPTPSAHSCAVLVNQNIGSEIVNHAHALVLDTPKKVALVVAGLGNIGQCFIEILASQLSQRPELDNTVLVGGLSSKCAWLDIDGIEPNKLLQDFKKQANEFSSSELIDWLSKLEQTQQFAEIVVVDITPSAEFAGLYEQFFEKGIHVIGANKNAGSDSQSRVNGIKALCAKHQAHWIASTTVGAGLPINATIDELASSGDSIEEISGIFSGTLSWLFQNYKGDKSFSELVLTARAQGLTEPDPRDDLSGLDVQRKLLILARDAGFELELEDIGVENLVPSSLQNVSLEEFIDRIDELDADFAARLSQAKAEQKILRYVARFALSQGKWQASVALEALPESSAFANLTPCDNVFMLVTQWYQDNPLIIRGPGAGREVTAGGLHADLIKLSRLLKQRALA